MLNYNHMGVGQKIREFRRERDWSQDYLGVSIEDVQKVVDANEKLIKELKHECDSSN